MSRTRLALLVLVGAAALGFAIERWIVTDAEAIERVLEDAAQDVVRGDDGALTARIVEDYAERGKDRAGLVAWARDLWRRSGARTMELDVGDTKVDGDRAAARVVVRPGMPWAGARLGGRIDLRRTNDGWRIEGVAPDDAAYLPR